MHGHACKQYIFRSYSTSTFNAVHFEGVNTAFIPCRKFGSPTLGTGTAAARAALPIPIRVCSSFLCPNHGMGASVWGFLTCALMLLHAIDDLRKSKGLYSISCIYRSMPVGVVQSRHAFVGGTVSTWGR